MPAGASPARTRIILRGLETPVDSSALLVFVGELPAGAKATEDHPSYAGTIYQYGHGQRDAARRAAPRAEAQRATRDVELSMPSDWKATGTTVPITLIARDANGRELSASEIRYTSVELVDAGQ